MSLFSKRAPAASTIVSGMPTRTLAAACLALVFAHAAAAQDRPDFSGTWVASGDSSAVNAAGKPLPPVWGAQFTIEHQGPALTVRRTFTGGPAVIAYKLDGSETTSRMPGRLCEADSGATWTADWNGQAIAIAMIGALPANGKAIKMDVKTTLRLESPDTMRVEMAARVPNQPEPRVSSSLYKRDRRRRRRSRRPRAAPKPRWRR